MSVVKIESISPIVDVEIDGVTHHVRCTPMSLKVRKAIGDFFSCAQGVQKNKTETVEDSLLVMNEACNLVKSLVLDKKVSELLINVLDVNDFINLITEINSVYEEEVKKKNAKLQGYSTPTLSSQINSNMT